MNYDEWHDSGKLYAKLGMYKQAMHCYEKAIKINPKNPVCWEYKGIALYELEKYQAALFCFDRVLCLNEKNPASCADSWYDKGRTLRKINKLWDALICFNECLKCHPGDEGAQEEIDELLKEIISAQKV